MAAGLCVRLTYKAPAAMAGPTRPPAAFTTEPAERINAPGSPQELREATNAASADHFKIRFITDHHPHPGIRVKREKPVA